MRKAHIVEGAAKPAGQYSHAVTANGFVYVSGQGPVDPKTGVMPDNFAEQIRQTIRNLETILKGVGASLDDPGFDPSSLCVQATEAHPEDRPVAPVAHVEEALGPRGPALGRVRLAV